MRLVFRTPALRFMAWRDFPFEPHTLDWEGLSMHYVDEGPRDAPVMLLLHGMPTSSYLYRRMIPPLLAAGYRCVAPDWIGFGKSDKVIDDAWYSIAKHTASCTHLIEQLDLRDITLVCQDWGGPIGLYQAVHLVERFSRLVIMNTWLHSPGHEYSDAIRDWNVGWHEGGRFDQLQACGFVMRFYVENFPGSPLSPQEAFEAYEAPFVDRASKAGARRFPLSIPFDDPEGGNASVQARCAEALATFPGPIHCIWGVLDDVFTEAWGRQWAAELGATFDPLEAGHFLQESHGPEIVEILLRRIAEE